VTNDAEAIYRLAKKVTVLVSAFLVCATAIGLLNKKFIADPIVRAVSDERVARQEGDSLIVNKLSQIQVNAEQLNAAIAAATYSRTQIDRMKWEAEQAHARLEDGGAQLDARVRALEARR